MWPPEYLHDKVLAPPDELILCVNYCLKEPEILKYKLDHPVIQTNLFKMIFTFFVTLVNVNNKVYPGTGKKGHL